jgi:hypothetical protein
MKIVQLRRRHGRRNAVTSRRASWSTATSASSHKPGADRRQTVPATESASVSEGVLHVRRFLSALFDALALATAAWRLIETRASLALRPGPALAPRMVRRGAFFWLQATPPQLARAVERASRHLPYRPTCLERALVLDRLLGSAALERTLVIGVRRNGDALEAHAWIERDGHALIGAPQPGRYAVLLNRLAGSSPCLES